jgi:hypothetical protein
MSGKGSRRRPAFIPIQDFGENWAKIFEKPKQEKESDDNSTNGKSRPTRCRRRQRYRKQTGGTHYKNMAIQPAEYAEKNGLSLLEGNVVKYITRWKLKGQPLSDLEKAKHCIDLLIEIHNVK